MSGRTSTSALHSACRVCVWLHPTPRPTMPPTSPLPLPCTPLLPAPPTLQASTPQTTRPARSPARRSLAAAASTTSYSVMWAPCPDPFWAPAPPGAAGGAALSWPRSAASACVRCAELPHSTFDRSISLCVSIALRRLSTAPPCWPLADALNVSAELMINAPGAHHLGAGAWRQCPLLVQQIQVAPPRGLGWPGVHHATASV